MKRKLKKLYKMTSLEKKEKPNEFFFDNGHVCKYKDFVKDNLKYSVMMVDKGTNEYIVYLLAIYNNKSIPQLLKKNFKNKRGTKKYFEDLCDFVINNENQFIINKCYNDKKSVFRYNILNKVKMMFIF